MGGGPVTAPLDDRVTQWVARLDVGGDPRRVVVAAAAACAAPGMVAIAAGGSPVVRLCAWVGPVVMLLAWARGRAASRPRRIVVALPDHLRAVAAGVRSGMSLRSALGRAAEESHGAVGEELRAVCADIDGGGRLQDALEALCDRVPHPDIQVLTCAVMVTLRSGGDVARVLTESADGIEQRQRIAGELEGMSRQARMTAWIVAALPVVGATLVEIVAPGLLGRTLGSPFGMAAAAVSTLLMVGAMLLIRGLARVGT